jgi:hypothetical protein
MDENTGNTAAVASGTTLGIVLLTLAIVYRCTNWATRYRLSCVHSDGSFGCICREANVPNPLDAMAKAHAEVVKQLQDDLKSARDALIQQRVDEAHRRREAEERAQRNLRSLRRDFQRALTRHRVLHQSNGSDDSSPLSEHQQVPPGLLNTDSMQRLRMRVSMGSPKPVNSAPAQHTPLARNQPHAAQERQWPCLTPTTTVQTEMPRRGSELHIDIDEPVATDVIRVQPFRGQVSMSSSAPLQSTLSPAVSVSHSGLSQPTGNAPDNGPAAVGSDAHGRRNQGNDSNCHPPDCGYEV